MVVVNAGRAVLAVLGTTLLGLGLVTTLVAGATTGAIGAVVGLLGNDYLFVVPLGLVGVGAMAAALVRRSVRGVDQATPGDPERVPTGDPPGASFDRLLGGGIRAALDARRRRERARGRLRGAAVRTVMRSANCSHGEALRRVDEGSWTDDPAAASFLAEDGDRRVGILAAVAAIRGAAPFQRRARRAVRAIERVDGGDRG